MGTNNELVCKKCGATNPKGWRFCNQCGKKPNPTPKIEAALFGEVKVAPDASFAKLADELLWPDFSPTAEEFEQILKRAKLTELQRQLLIRYYALDQSGKQVVYPTIRQLSQERERNSHSTSSAIGTAKGKLAQQLFRDEREG